MSSETITRNDLKAVLDKVLTAVPSSQIYEAAWTATSSNANLQQVSDSITIPAGTYIFSIKIPICSQDALAFCVYPFDLAAGGWFGAGQVVQNYIYKVSETTTCYIATSMSTATDYTYTERGYLKAIRIAPYDSGHGGWEKIGSIVGTQTLTYPEEANELYVVLSTTISSGLEINTPIHILLDTIESTYTEFYGGARFQNTYGVGGCVGIRKETRNISTTGMYYNDVIDKSNVTIKAYYK